MGRDDLSNDILMAAEGIFRRVSPHQSKAVRVLAERIKKLIEADARRFITEAIETEKELTNIELREKSRGRIVVDHPEYNQKRSKVI